jgi:hypothetical protein
MERLKREEVERLFFVKSPTEEKCRFTVPPAVALLNYISCGILWRIFCQTGIFTGFLAVRISEAAMGGAGDILLIKKNETKKVSTYGRTGIYINFDTKWIKKGLAPRKTSQNDGYVYIINMHVCNTTNS